MTKSLLFPLLELNEEPSVSSSTQAKPSCSYQHVIVDGRAASRIPKIPVVKLPSPPLNNHHSTFQGAQGHRKRPTYSSRTARRVCNGSGYWSPQQLEAESQDEIYQDVEPLQVHTPSPGCSSLEQGTSEEQVLQHRKQQQQVKDEHSYPEQGHDSEDLADDDSLIVEAEISCIMEEPGTPLSSQPGNFSSSTVIFLILYTLIFCNEMRYLFLQLSC